MDHSQGESVLFRLQLSVTRRLRRLLKTFVRWGFSLVLAFYSFSVLSLVYVKFCDPPSTSVQGQRRIESFFTPRPYTKRYTVVPLSRIANHLIHAAIAAEDARFFQHYGIDWVELQKVLATAWHRGELERGASTITQQLIKNLLLTTYGSILRKACELTLAPLAELLLSKERILALYLNIVEWGPGVYGAEAAAQYYYGIPAARLSREQAARLVACLPAPRSRIPQHMDHLSQQILARMRSMGW
jgi:monofunctional biosynthetic peptidoglycan transglycosylase